VAEHVLELLAKANDPPHVACEPSPSPNSTEGDFLAVRELVNCSARLAARLPRNDWAAYTA